MCRQGLGMGVFFFRAEGGGGEGGDGAAPL